MSYVLGIDGGGTKTVCILMDENRQVVGRGEAGASNYQTIGISNTINSINLAIQRAIAERKDLTIISACLGLAGVSRPRDIEVIKDLLMDLQFYQNLPLNWQLKLDSIVICNDAFIALVGGLGHGTGIVAISGTGSIIFGRNHLGETKRVGGWGHILGDEGSAYQIAVSGMQAALKAYDGREFSTSLVAGFQEHLGLVNIENLIEVIYRRGWGVKEIAALAAIVDSAAVNGDAIANRIIEDAVQDLVKSTATVIEAIFPHHEDCEIVTSGGVWQGKANIQGKFAGLIGKKFPQVQVISPKYEPAYGAALLALENIRCC
jgi:N-acetylglucosamine kinase-like BadF-type ATPase